MRVRCGARVCARRSVRDASVGRARGDERARDERAAAPADGGSCAREGAEASALIGADWDALFGRRRCAAAGTLGLKRAACAPESTTSAEVLAIRAAYVLKAFVVALRGLRSASRPAAPARATGRLRGCERRACALRLLGTHDGRMRVYGCSATAAQRSCFEHSSHAARSRGRSVNWPWAGGCACVTIATLPRLRWLACARASLVT